MKSFASHTELALLLDALKKQGAIINEGNYFGQRYILENFRENTGEVMFMAKPYGRKDNEVYYKLKWTPAFDKAMQPITQAGAN